MSDLIEKKELKFKRMDRVGVVVETWITRGAFPKKVDYFWPSHDAGEPEVTVVWAVEEWELV